MSDAAASETARREWVFQGAQLRAICDNPNAPHLRVKFSHRMQGRSDFDDLPKIAPAKDAGFAQLYVQTKSNDYYLNDDLPALRAALFDYTSGYDRREANGYSMGGFATMLLARALRLKKVFLVSPMSKSFFKAPPYDFGSAAERALFFGSDPLAGVQQGLQGTIICDPTYRGGRDYAYARLVQSLNPDLQVLCLPWAGHPATKLWSEARSFGAVRQAYFDGTATPAHLKSLQRAQRMESLRYVQGMLDYMAQRGQRG